MADKFIAFNAYGDKQKYVDNGDDASYSQSVAVEKSALPTGAATSAKQDEIISAIRNITEASVDTGMATAGTVNSITDSAKDWPINAFEKLVVEITDGTGEGQIRRITSNTADTLTVDPAFAIAPDDTSQYRIAFFGKMASDITHIGGAAQTGRDWSGDLANLDVALSTLATNANQEAIAGYIDQIEGYVDGLEAAIGTTADAEASGDGSLIAVVKKLRTLLNGGLPTALTASGGVKAGIVESLPEGANNIGKVDVNTSALPTGAATSDKQDTIITYIDQLGEYIDGIETALGTAVTDPVANTILARLKTLATLIGEASDTPTDKTLLARVKNLETKIDAIITNGIPLAESKVKEHTFHHETAAAAEGAAFVVGGYKVLTVEIYGTSTERAVVFMGGGPSGEARYIAGVKLSDLSLATSTTGNEELWQFDITGLCSVNMEITSVAGGNVTVKGRAAM